MYQGPARSDVLAKAVFGRHRSLHRALERHLPGLPAAPVVLYVGVGADDPERWQCASHPFEVAALLDGARKGYSMDILDLDADRLAMAQARERICVYKEQLRSPGARDAWQRYLASAGVSDRRVWFGKEARTAPIPPSFAAKRATGAIQFRHADVVTASLPAERYDLSLCLAVTLHLYNSAGRTSAEARATADEALTQAISNMARSLRPGGMLVVDDGNWVWDDYRAQERLEARGTSAGLRVVEVIPIPRYPFAHTLFQKPASQQ